MKTRYLFAFLVLGISFVGCSRHNEDEYNPIAKNLVFKASWENEIDTKTVLQENGTSIWWSTSEKINVFYGKTRSGVFTSTNTEPAEVTTFTGELILKDIVQEDATSAGYWAVYPYNENNTCDGESVTLSVPSNQSATEGTFADNFFPAIATSNNSSLSFYNVCGGIRFSVYNQGIISLIIKSNAGESLVGTVQVCFDGNGKPYVKSLSDGSSEVIVSSPEGGFVPSKYYFAAMIPQTLAGGLSITYVLSDGTKATYSIDKEIKVNRARFGKVDVKDSIVINPDLGDVTILSDDETANCYIVSSEGEYAFDARVIGNGAKGIMHGFNFHTENPNIAPETVELLWQDNEIISDLRLQSGYIVFSANSNKGNALIAAKDANNHVLWSWHIWATERPKPIQFSGAQHSYLDRNLGATTSTPGEQTTNGLYYQWGRKDPFRQSGNTVEPTPDPLNVADLVASPTVLYYTEDRRWVDYPSALWGNPDGPASMSTYKTIYDPCPSGYTIPSYDAWYENDYEFHLRYDYTDNSSRPPQKYYSLYDPNIEYSNVNNAIVAQKGDVSICYPFAGDILGPDYLQSSSTYYHKNCLQDKRYASALCVFPFEGNYNFSAYNSTNSVVATPIRCIKEESPRAFVPTVTTNDASDLRVDALTLNGIVDDTGNATIGKTGFIWGSSQNDLNHEVISNNAHRDGYYQVFSSKLEDNSPHAVVYYRAFAENSEGRGYGNLGIARLRTATEYAITVLDSLSRFMTTQYLSTQGMNGEGTIRLWYGDLPGNSMMAAGQNGWAPLWNSDYLTRSSSVYDYYPMFYYYRIINKVNDTIDNYLPLADDQDKNINHYKAELLGYRAYAYMMLAQLYCKSWDASNSGSSSGLPLRISAHEDVTTISSLSDVYSQIYADLDAAIAIMKESDIQRKDVNEINLETLYAIYAKAALNRQDYSRAATCARYARNGHNLMSNLEYNSGFRYSNNEWIWGAHPETQLEGGIQLFYYSYFAYLGYNASSSAVRSYPKCISKELFDLIPATDIRKKLFLDPVNYSYSKTDGKAGDNLKAYAFSYAAADGRLGLYSSANVYAYMQFKIGSSYYPGGGQQNFIRAAEMVLTEAEAAFYMGNESDSRALLNYLNKESGRDPSYDCSKSGSALLDEIKLYRRIELWGEGFDWFDTKRWGDPINRKTFAEGGNFADVFAGTWTAADKNDFVWIIPEKYEIVIRNESALLPSR